MSILCDKLDIPLILAPGAGVPSRTLAKYEKSPVSYQATPLIRTRPVVPAKKSATLSNRPSSSVTLQGAGLVDLARGAVITRRRESLDAFAYADAHDVSLLDDDLQNGGLQFVLYGVVPSDVFCWRPSTVSWC